MSYPFNYPTPVNCDIQSFVGGARLVNNRFSWQKPQGCSFVWFTLIGAGGSGGIGDGTNAGAGGGSGAVTNCLMPAFLVPDSLLITLLGSATVQYRTKTGIYNLLQADAGSGASGVSPGAGGVASSVKNFGCAGLFQSVAGQDGAVATNITPSATTFLSGGTGGDSFFTITANYGYTNSSTSSVAARGFLLTQPILVGLGAANRYTVNNAVESGGIGCGGSGNNSTGTSSSGQGGPPMAVIISW